MRPTNDQNQPEALGVTIFLFTLGSLALALPWLSGIVTIPWDAKAHFFAQIEFLARSFQAGESPFWNPYIFAGHAQIADPQSQIFSPPYLLLAYLNSAPGFVAVDAVTFAMLWVGGLAIIMFCFDRGWHPAAAMVAAFAFANGGSAAWRVQHTGEVISFCWFGVTLWLLARTLDRRSILYGIAAGVTSAFMVLGRDQIAYLCVLILAGYVVWRMCAGEGRWARIRSWIAPLAAASITGFALVIVPLALTIAIAEQSSRVDIGYQGAAYGSLPPPSFLTWVVANLFGTDGPMVDYWGPPSSQIWGPNQIALARNMADVYSGAIPFVAIVTFGLVRGGLGERKIRYFTLALIAMVLFAVGDFTPFFKLAFQLPGISLFRRPADATFPIGGLVAIVGGYCVHRILTDNKSPSRTRSAIEVAAVVFLLGLCAFVAYDKGRLDQAMPALQLGAILLAVSGLVLATGARLGRRNETVLMFVVAIVMILDLGVSNGPNESTALPPEAYDVLRPDTTNETIALLKQRIRETAEPDRRDRVELGAVGFEWPNAGMVHHLDHWLGYNPIVSKNYSLATGAIDHVAIPEQRKFAPLFPGYRSTMADLLGVRWIATGVPAAELDKKFQPGDLMQIARTKDAYIYENARALPRVLLATEARKADFDDMIRTGVWPDFDYRRTVLLENAPATAATPRAAGTAHLDSYANTRIMVDADAPQGGYVVLTDVWHPWWTATVDGAPAEILRADVLFRAVEIPPGRHKVEFVFRPFSGLLKQARALF